MQMPVPSLGHQGPAATATLVEKSDLRLPSLHGWLRSFQSHLASKGIVLKAARQASASEAFVRFDLDGQAEDVPLLCSCEITMVDGVAFVTTVTAPGGDLVMRYRTELVNAADKGHATQDQVLRRLNARVQPSRVADTLQEALARRLH